MGHEGTTLERQLKSVPLGPTYNEQELIGNSAASNFTALTSASGHHLETKLNVPSHVALGTNTAILPWHRMTDNDAGRGLVIKS